MRRTAEQKGSTTARTPWGKLTSSDQMGVSGGRRLRATWSNPHMPRIASVSGSPRSVWKGSSRTGCSSQSTSTSSSPAVPRTSSQGTRRGGRTPGRNRAGPSAATGAPSGMGSLTGPHGRLAGRRSIAKSQPASRSVELAPVSVALSAAVGGLPRGPSRCRTAARKDRAGCRFHQDAELFAGPLVAAELRARRAGLDAPCLHDLGVGECHRRQVGRRLCGRSGGGGRSHHRSGAGARPVP